MLLISYEQLRPNIDGGQILMLYSSTLCSDGPATILRHFKVHKWLSVPCYCSLPMAGATRHLISSMISTDTPTYRVLNA